MESIESVKHGVGDILESLVMILGFGAMLGKIVADSGAAQSITGGLIKAFGKKNVQYALVLTGFVVGIPMFYSVGFVILVPLVFTIAASTGLPLIYVGLPMLASLSVTHGYLPPHPAPTTIAVMYEADIGMTLLYGVIIAVPAILAALVYSRTIKGIEAKPLKEFLNPNVLTEDELPGFGLSVAIALLPVILILALSLSQLLLPESSRFLIVMEFLGEPSIALLISVLAAVYVLGIRRGQKMTDVMSGIVDSVKSIGMILLIVSGAGALKAVILDSGTGEYIASLLGDVNINPLVMAWGLAAVMRISVGSATVAGLTTAGIMLPFIQTIDTSAELVVLATGAGTLVMSHVNDSGFWMFKEYFNLSIKDTLRSWTVMETIVSIVGLLGVLVLDVFI
jgi:Gnt-I system high-affinity gluconate transporter